MKVAIIGAMEKEIKFFQEKIAFTKEKFIGKGTYHKHTIYLMKCGIGKVNAAWMLQYLLDHYEVDLILNTGCCGALKENLNLLDVILASHTTYHDFYPERILKEAVFNHGVMKSDEQILKSFQKELEKENIPYQIGGICSGDHFVTDKTIKEKIRKQTNAIAVDMESAAIAQVASMNQVPYFILRTISDHADGVADFEEKASQISGEIILNWLQNHEKESVVFCNKENKKN